ncbi:hypothetical protein BCR44DRAFT_44894 [Catenaria anguillulae PL171]|uniref:protein S-acyltransferase n=1 Tax=Catenaria anguillulae PL171 TaxID=765915 RepID=A0A1Y2HRJ7_9FUNG|nr:hypothetical protein BCR44DRAFT_44894 [Catenaria anguillulae PL171]
MDPPHPQLPPMSSPSPPSPSSCDKNPESRAIAVNGTNNPFIDSESDPDSDSESDPANDSTSHAATTTLPPGVFKVPPRPRPMPSPTPSHSHSPTPSHSHSHSHSHSNSNALPVPHNTPPTGTQQHQQEPPSASSFNSVKSTASTIAIYSSSPSTSATNVLHDLDLVQPPPPIPPLPPSVIQEQPPVAVAVTVVQRPQQPLHQHLRDACIHGHLPAVRALLESPSSADQQPLTATTPGDDGIPPLHWAAVNNHAAIARYLIDHHGAPVDTPAGTMRATPLSWAARKGHAAMVNLLVSRGASPHAPDADGMHPIHLAAHHGWAYLVLLLVAGLGVDANQRDASEQARPPLFFAIISNTRGGSYDAACVLLAMGADPNAKVGGFPILHWALHRRALRVAELLVTYGAQPDLTDPMGRTAAQVAREAVDVDGEWIDTWLMPTSGNGGSRRRPNKKPWFEPVSDKTADRGFALLPGLQAIGFIATSSLPWYINLFASLILATLLHFAFMKLLLRRTHADGGDDPMEPPTLRHPRPHRAAPPGTVAGHRAVASSPYLAALIAWTLFVGGTHWAVGIAPWVKLESSWGVFVAAWIGTLACLYGAVLGDPGYLPQCGMRGVWPPPHKAVAPSPTMTAASAAGPAAASASVAVAIDEAQSLVSPLASDPGASPKDLQHPGVNVCSTTPIDGRAVAHLADRDLLDDMHFCLSCMNRRPLRSKHCKQCGRCVVRFDHHCPWTWNCIGANNHRVFILLLIGIIFLALWFMSDWSLASDIRLAALPARDAAKLTQACLGFGPCIAFTLDPVGGWISVFGVIQVTWVALLLAQQVYHAASNATTNEWINWFKYDHTSVPAAGARGTGGIGGAVDEYRSARNREWHPVLDRGVARNCAEFWCAPAELYAGYFEVEGGHPGMSRAERVAVRDEGVRRGGRSSARAGGGWWARLVGGRRSEGPEASPLRGVSSGGEASGTGGDGEGEALIPMPVSVRR